MIITQKFDKIKEIEMNTPIIDKISENVNVCSNPSELKITDIRVANITGAPKHCPLIKIYTNQGLVSKQYKFASV